MDKFFGVIKAKNVLRGAQQSKTGQSNAASMRQRRGKRSDIDPAIIYYTDNSGNNSRRLNGCVTGVVCAILSFLCAIAAHFHVRPGGNHFLLLL
uniref:Pecanex-like protein n=1 Tax=Globodera pallida TaxID=36090 RepID=A0A183CGV9_GLOPA